MYALCLALTVMFPANDAERALPAIRLIDLNADGRLDQLRTSPDGSLRVALNVGTRAFEEVEQTLPPVLVNSILADDLNGDGNMDLYIVSPQANSALLGDGSGRLFEATDALGLADAGEGLGAGRVDIDGDGILDLLLQNRAGDVIFWGTEGGYFERDPATPDVSSAPLAAPTAVSLESDKPVAEAGIPVAAPARMDGRPGQQAASGSRRPLASAAPVGGGGVQTAVAAPNAGGTLPISFVPICTLQIKDVTSGACISADTTPTLGRLLPQSSRLFVTPGGDVGVGTLAPAEDLHVIGETRADAYFIEGATEAVHRGTTGRFGQASSFTFDGFLEGAMLEGGASESGGFFANGNIAAIWSPGDPDILRVYDEDAFFAGSVDPYFTIDGGGDLEQQLFMTGTVKAACQIDASSGTPVITRQFNNLPGNATITVLDLAVGTYEVDFGAVLTSRHWQGTLGNSSSGTPLDGSMSVTPRAGNTEALFVNTYDLTGANLDNNFYIVVY